MDKNQTEGVRVGNYTDLNFMVMPFIAGTGEAVMCSIILKSEKKPEDVPALLHLLGLDT